ncbi:MAG TPA: (Fe-S)-binding protein [Geobacteraceae bacterium]
MQPNPAIFTPLLAASLACFAWGCYRRLALVRLGRPEERLDRPARRLGKTLLFALGQKRVAARPFGVNHVVIFWAFLVLLLANGEFILQGVIPGLTLSALLPAPLRHALLLCFDLASLLVLAATLLSGGRRLFFKPASLDSTYVKGRSFEAFFILGCIALLMLAYFGLHGDEIAAGHEERAWMPVSAFTARLLLASPLAFSLQPLAWFFWWLHALVLLAFICFLPVSKHMHILTAIPNCFLAGLEKPLVPAREEFTTADRFGAGAVNELGWKDLFDAFTCTECGRCQGACPAVATGKPLNPRQVVHAIKTNLLANGPLLKEGNAPEFPLIGEEGEGTLTAEAVWSCTTCGACLEACPVLIEQPPKIVELRRHLVQMAASFPEELLNLFENMEQRSNPWGIAPGERGKWASQLAVRPFDAGTTVYLFYVGCAGAFDARNKQVTVAMATILNAAGVSWGVLGREERCCGDSVRRLGNEYLFEKMAQENVRLFREKGVTRVITQCPHCFSTLKNDYRQHGLELEVIHHTEFIGRLLETGRLTLNRQVTDLGRILFHDSCYLGRHNGVYAAPREVLTKATGRDPAEFGRKLGDSFCCGAGGGRMWLEEQSGTRINRARVGEAMEAKPDTVCVSCPYCLTMFEDGVKDERAGQVRVRDVAEVVLEGLG